MCIFGGLTPKSYQIPSVLKMNKLKYNFLKYQFLSINKKYYAQITSCS